MRETLRFETNVPQAIALAFDDGMDVAGRFGDQVMYTLTDDRVMYVPPAVRSRLKQLGVRRGEEFTICKAEVREGIRRRIEWRVTRAGETLAPEAAQPVGKPAAAPVQGEVRANHSAPVQADGSTNRPPDKANGKPNGQGAMAGAPPACDQIPDAMSVAAATMAAALCGAMDAVEVAEKHSHQRKCGIRFSTEDVRAIALTLYIQLGKGGAR